MNRETWQNGKRKVTGHWQYNRQRDTFSIFLDQKDRVTGQNKFVETSRDVPEWGNWKRVQESLA